MINEEADTLEKITADYILFKANAYRKTEEKMDSNDFIIRSPKATLTFIIIITLIFSSIVVILTAGSLVDDALTLIALSIFSLCLLFCIFSIIILIRYKIIIKDNQITFVYMFRKKKSFAFDYITTVKFTIIKHGNYMDGIIKNITITAYHEKELLFSFTPGSPGCNILVSRLKAGGIPFTYENTQSPSSDKAKRIILTFLFVTCHLLFDRGGG